MTRCYSDEICGTCNGSGEGMHDGTTCIACCGMGVERDYDAEYDAMCDAADHWYDERKDRDSSKF